MSKKKDFSVKKKKKHSGNSYKRKFFGSVEYIEDEFGRVVEIRASNGTFKIKNSPFF